MNSLISFSQKNKYNIFLGLFILLSIAFKIFQLGNQLTNKIQLTNTLDFSWSIDITERLLHGYIAGRDFIFTYGPLYQFINSIPSLLFGLPSYSSILLSPIIFTLLNCLFIIFITKSITTRKKDHFLLTAPLLFATSLTSFPDPNNLTRILLPLVYTILYLKNTNNLSSLAANQGSKHFIKTLAILALPAIFGLYTYDLFITCIISTFAILFYNFFTAYIKERKKKNVLSFQRTRGRSSPAHEVSTGAKANQESILFGILQIIIIFGWELLTSIFLTDNLNYLLYSLDTIRSYQFIMNIPFSLNKSTLFFIYPISALILFIFIYRSRIKTSQKTLLLLMFTTFIELKAAFIRSDDGHLLIGAYPSIIMSIILLYNSIREKIRGWYIIFLLLVLLLIPYKDHSLIDHSLNNIKQVFYLKDKTFFDIYQLPNDYYLSKDDFNYLSTFIPQNKHNVMIFPYDNYILNVYGNTYNTLPLQWYDYSNSLVEKDAVEKLRQSSPKFIILGIDNKGVLALDNIPNLSRNPLVAKWMLSNYSVLKNKEKYVILKYDPERKAKASKENCSIYDINTTDIMKANILEKMLKPSTYYLENDKGIRLPNIANTSEIFIVEKYDNSDELQKLFERKINFNKSHEQKKHFLITHKSPIPKIKDVYDGNVFVTCF